MANYQQTNQQQMVLAAIYVPWQDYGPIYQPNEALKYGTVFRALNQPYVPLKKK